MLLKVDKLGYFQIEQTLKFNFFGHIFCIFSFNKNFKIKKNYVVFVLGKKIMWFLYLEKKIMVFFFQISKLYGFCILEKKIMWFLYLEKKLWFFSFKFQNYMVFVFWKKKLCGFCFLEKKLCGFFIWNQRNPNLKIWSPCSDLHFL